MKNPNIVAAGVIGVCMLIAASIIGSGLNAVAREVRAKPLPTSSSPHIPTEFTVSLKNGNGFVPWHIEQSERK